MKKRLAPILTIGFAIILIGSLAYAADRKKAKRIDQSVDRTHEEEALRAELLDEAPDRDRKPRDAGDTGKPVGSLGGKTDRQKAKK